MLSTELTVKALIDRFLSRLISVASHDDKEIVRSCTQSDGFLELSFINFFSWLMVMMLQCGDRLSRIQVNSYTHQI